jgi:hypothetical protein
MLFASWFDDLADILGNPIFLIVMGVLFVALIGLFIYLRKRGSSED